jgi:ferredoxin-NADP reductase
VPRCFRKRRQPRASVELSEVPTRLTPLTNHANPKGPIRLLLSQIERQTHDAKTLRFQILGDRQFGAKPGQFLTFQWPIDGQRIMRSYTVSSSPVHKDYVEITPKRMENASVSVFLNERAKPGLVVEANGPYGQFYFDENLHKSIVLIAAGSGITPMISMLRYIDDLEVAIPVMFLYCVRTAADVIFENELSRLSRSLPNFKYELCPSRPDPAWNGRSGRLSEEFISENVSHMDSPAFCLCGPNGFMDNARQVLLTLGVTPDRILQ